MGDKRFKITLLITGIIFLGLIHLWYRDFWEIDRCLDQGSVWNYEQRQCEFE